jgi:hypothetical protein
MSSRSGSARSTSSGGSFRGSFFGGGAAAAGPQLNGQQRASFESECALLASLEARLTKAVVEQTAVMAAFEARLVRAACNCRARRRQP